MADSIQIREAVESDAASIGEIFSVVYDAHYAHQEYCDEQAVKKIIYDDSNLTLVAEDSETGRILGTGSVIFEIGGHGDLVGEFGRLAVHPDGRKRGIGKMLMAERLKRIEGRLHLGLVENRVAHPYSQKISAEFGFCSVGLLPQKLLFTKRESLALYAHYFDDALTLRKNNPQVIPEAFPLAQAVMQNAGLEADVIADEDSPPYPSSKRCSIEEFETQGYASLLRFERSQASHREILGPIHLHQGAFRMQAAHSNYLLAKNDGRLAGAIGFTHDPVERNARIFEIVTTDERSIYLLLSELETKLCEDLKVEYVEVDVSAYAPRMQRTLLELGFLPVAYIPALAFQGAERLDAVRMARLFVPLDIRDIQLYETSEAVAATVIHNFSLFDLSPKIAAAIPGTALFRGLTDEQTNRLAAEFHLEEFEAGGVILSHQENSSSAFIILSGEVEVSSDNVALATLAAGDCLGETSLLDIPSHQVQASATRKTEVAAISADEFTKLIRRRPDIGMIVYRNLATELGTKLRTTDERLTST